MPELPEVETIARFLREGGRGQDSILYAVISRSELTWLRTLSVPRNPSELEARLPGQKIMQIGRRGKYLLLHLDRDTLLFHLRMSGDLIVSRSDELPGPYYRFFMDFTDGRRLAFDDARKFGRIWLTAEPGVVLSSLGPEPLGPEFTSDWLYSQLQSRRRQLKPLLLDQSFIAGIGNIYADEALFRARLHPLRQSASLTRDDAERLRQAIQDSLAEGIAREGASIDWVYRGGEFQNHFNVYQRTAEPCPRCGTPIERIVVGQRGTHFCPKCQLL